MFEGSVYNAVKSDLVIVSEVLGVLVVVGEVFEVPVLGVLVLVVLVIVGKVLVVLALGALRIRRGSHFICRGSLVCEVPCVKWSSSAGVQQ